MTLNQASQEPGGTAPRRVDLAGSAPATAVWVGAARAVTYRSAVANGSNADSPNGAALFEAANKLRGSVESSEYKHLVLGLLFLKYISDSFKLRRAELNAELSNPSGGSHVEDPDERAAIVEDRDEYVSHNAFWVPDGARAASNRMTAPRSNNSTGSPAGVSIAFFVMIVPAIEAAGLYAPSGDLTSASLILAAVGMGCGATALALATRWRKGARLAKLAWGILLLISSLDSLLMLLLWVARD